MSRGLLSFVTVVLWTTPCLAEDDTEMPSIVHEACAQYAKGKDYEILARFEDKSQLFDPKVMYRSRSDAHWKQAPFNKQPGTEDFKAVIKARDLSGPLEYFIEVFDEYGNGPARMGGPELPIRVLPVKKPKQCEQIPALATWRAQDPSRQHGPFDPGPPPPQGPCDKEDRPLYCEAWLWGTVGAVLAGAGVAIYFAASGDESTNGSKTVTVRIKNGPNPTLAPLWWRQ